MPKTLSCDTWTRLLSFLAYPDFRNEQVQKASRSPFMFLPVTLKLGMNVLLLEVILPSCLLNHSLFPTKQHSFQYRIETFCIIKLIKFAAFVDLSFSAAAEVSDSGRSIGPVGHTFDSETLVGNFLFVRVYFILCFWRR